MGEEQLHDSAGGIVNVDQQCARRRALLEPAVIATIDRGQLATAGTAIPWLIDLGRPLFGRNPARQSAWHAPRRGTTFELGYNRTLQLGANTLPASNKPYVK